MTEPTLAEWLLDQISADERVVPTPDFGRKSTSNAWYSTDFDVVFVEEDRWLAECAAKRAVIDVEPSRCGMWEPPGSEYRIAAEARAGEMGWEFHAHLPEQYEPFCDGCCAAAAVDHDHHRVLSILAAPYSDRPGFREEWRP